MTNIVGTVNLLNAALDQWKHEIAGINFIRSPQMKFLGSLGSSGYFNEKTPMTQEAPILLPKPVPITSSGHTIIPMAFPVNHFNCSNNYGPYQFPEKLIPLVINNIINNKPIPVYGKGENVRDWLYVEDHADAIELIFHKGKPGETYTIGGNNEWKNIDLVRELCRILDRKLNRVPGTSEKLITFVKDRAGHDARFAIDSSKIRSELGWKPSTSFKEGLEKTIDWYLSPSGMDPACYYRRIRNLLRKTIPEKVIGIRIIQP
jgi:dTDP-glucose 4,6-dehydratase